MSRIATAREILLLLREFSLELEKQIPADPVQLSFPTDGKGIRIKVSVRPGQKDQVPEMIPFSLNDDTLILPLEVAEDYQEYEPHSNQQKVGQY
jgi:hypothetical protein